MTPSATLLYLRTPLGRAAAFSPETKLSDQLKSMLKAVDGKTSVSALVMQFADADAAGLLEQLEGLGLIKLRVERADDARLLATVQPPQLMSTAPELIEHASIAAGQFDNLPAVSRLAALPAEDPVPQTALARIVDVMSTFVLTHMPQQSFTVLSRLDGIKTLSELQAELLDYAVLVKAAGSAGLVHMAELTERVQEATAAA